MQKLIVITGAAGFIGSAFVADLNSRGIGNLVLVDELKTSNKWTNLVGKQFVDYFHKTEFLKQLESSDFRKKIDCIVHMGACSSTTEQDGDYLMENNFRYSCRIAEACEGAGIRFIYASSAATYGAGEQGYLDDEKNLHLLRPLNRYGFSKQVFDLWLRERGWLNWAVGLKFFNVYGPNEYHKQDMRSMVMKAYEQIKETGAIKLFRSYKEEFEDGEQKRDFVYIKDCTNIMHWLIENREVSGIYNVGSGAARSWNDLANAVFRAMSLEPNIQYIDMPDSLRGQYQYFTQADLSKSQAAGLPAPVHSLEEGVADYVKGYLSQELRHL